MRISVGAQTTGKPVCVWRLLVLADGTLVSGDSDGAVQFWDGKFGALLQVSFGLSPGLFWAFVQAYGEDTYALVTSLYTTCCIFTKH